MRTVLFLLLLSLAAISCRQEPKPRFLASAKQDCQIDSVALAWFFAKHPLLADHRADVIDFYREKSSCAWFAGGRLTEQAHVLYTRLLELDQEGLPAEIPYRAQLETTMARSAPEPNSEMLLTALYYYYTCLIYGGLDHDRTMATGWFIPRQRSSYPRHIDSVLQTTGRKVFFDQYYHLQAALRKYRRTEKEGGWPAIAMPAGVTAVRPGDSSAIVPMVRRRLSGEGFKAEGSGEILDGQLADAIAGYLERNQRQPGRSITPRLLSMLNVPVSERIRTISLNMERCRWIDPKLARAQEYIAVNIPSYRLLYFRNGKPYFSSRVVVGKELSQTVVFSGELSYITFSPYWNVPKSILQNEILPAIKKDPGYLQKHNMEWNGKNVRQRPGPDNSLGLVKFMFPNSNNIYLHDTPAKSLFSKEERAFSHGCVRVERARELALEITARDGSWTPEMVDEAMARGVENNYVLKKKIPVYIAYFTAWADSEGNVAFFDDIYKRDPALSEMLFRESGH